jgi:hypothetical protein
MGAGQVIVAEGLPEVATRLAASGLRVADLALRRPTLDDVFLALTGQPVGSAGHAAPPGTGPRDRNDPAPAA